MLSLDEILFDEEPHTYSYKGQRYDSVTQVIQSAGLGDDFSAVPSDRMEYARRRGQMVHLACQYFDEGDLDLETVAPEIRGYVEAYLLFRMEKKILPIEIEQMLISPWGCAVCGHAHNNGLAMRCIEFACGCLSYIQGLGLGGTPDLVCFMDGQRCVIDRKTSQYMSRAMGLQTAGYKLMWNRGRPSKPIRERYGLRLEKTGKYKLLAHEDPDDEVAFLDGLEHAKSLRKVEKWQVKYGNGRAVQAMA